MCRSSVFVVCVCAASAVAMELKVDIGATGQVVKAGRVDIRCVGAMGER